MRKYEITKDQINEYVEQHPCCGATKQTLQDLFPDAFKKELKLESGKWYVGYHYADRFLVCLNLTDELETHDLGYGFNKSNGWTNDLSFLKTFDYGFELATEKEVYEALKNEALKRGFVEGVYFLGSAGNLKNTPVRLGGFKYACNTSGFSDCNIGLYYSDSWIFNAGKWATLVKTKTKSEAEKELNCKIID